MVKRRTPPVAKKKELTAEEIDRFANAADQAVEQEEALDPTAKRDYKAIRVPFNEYEFQKLEELAKKTGRTKLNVIRWAILQMWEDEHKWSKNGA